MVDPSNSHARSFAVRLRLADVRDDSPLLVQNAVIELFLVGKADFAVTSPKSSFSALGAAVGGNSTQRVGEISASASLHMVEHFRPCEIVPEWRDEASCEMKRSW